ncbi:hypothetical protein LUZ61_013355 [Rhynchospora tenuis]|uniref:Uncharacterized protein n=1 Tax=Rhynchospora tenuis TaxID=198213 RepID=A0AAD5W8J4_9POAL|nr:hypothetical protein LUZ61_013355 [Rhynchospora tenuis]
MASNNDSRVYMGVINDVIGKVRDEFINYGAGEAVLSEIQSLWEMKMMQSSAASHQATLGQVNPVHDLNVPYEGPTAEMLFPPTPLQTPIQTRDFFALSTGKRERDEHPSHLPPDSYIYMPQQDGSSDFIIEFEMGSSSSQVDQQGNESSSIPQHYGIHDEHDYWFQHPSVPAEDYNNVVQTPTEHELRTPTPPLNPIDLLHETSGDDDDEELPLNEDDEEEEEEAEPTTQPLVLAQFDKVTRTKKTNKWKCTLKDGIMLLNNRDILFNKAKGEFDFYKKIDEMAIGN